MKTLKLLFGSLCLLFAALLPVLAQCLYYNLTYEWIHNDPFPFIFSSLLILILTCFLGVFTIISAIDSKSS